MVIRISDEVKINNHGHSGESDGEEWAVFTLEVLALPESENGKCKQDNIFVKSLPVGNNQRVAKTAAVGYRIGERQNKG